MSHGLFFLGGPSKVTPTCCISVVRQHSEAASVPPKRSTTTTGPFWYCWCESSTNLGTRNSDASSALLRFGQLGQ